MKQQPQNQASGVSETTRFFCTQISPAAGAAGELNKNSEIEPSDFYPVRVAVEDVLHLFLRRMMLDGIENRNGSQNRQT